LHKIREILVGPTTRAIDERLDAFRKQIDTANQKSQQETRTRLEHQQVKNGAAVEQAQRTFESKLDELRKQTGASSERIFKAQVETREWIEREMESMFSEMSLRVASESGAPIDASRPDDDFDVVLDQPKRT